MIGKTCYSCINHGVLGQSNCITCEPMHINWKPKQLDHDDTLITGMPRGDYNYLKSSLNKQEGGQHYKDKAIQPIVYIHANNLGFCEGNVVKYITRHKEKNGAEDIRKVIHYCELLLELEYKNE